MAKRLKDKKRQHHQQLSKRLKMCDISAVVGMISMVNANCWTEPYLPSCAFVSKLNFCGVPVTETVAS